MGVSLGSGFSSVTPALKGTSPVTGFEVAVAGMGSSELGDTIVAGTGAALTAKLVLENRFIVEANSAEKLRVVEDDQPRMTGCRDRNFDMRVCDTCSGGGIGSSAGQDIFVGSTDKADADRLRIWPLVAYQKFITNTEAGSTDVPIRDATKTRSRASQPCDIQILGAPVDA